MSYIKLQILNKNNVVLKEIYGEEEVNLVYHEKYQEGDKIILDVEELDVFYHLQFDDAKGKSLVYITGKVEYKIPFDEKRINFHQRFFGETDMLYQ